MDLTRRIRDKMMRKRLMFVYRGIVTNVNSISLLMLLEKEMEYSDFGFVGRKRLFMFVLESLQNISRHSTKDQHSIMSLVAYSKTPEGYTVTTGNVMDKSHVPELRLRLREINKLNPDEVKTYYRQMLDASKISDKGGAGLGLIEMAKKTGNKLDFDFIKVDEQNYYYVLSKTVDSGGTGANVADQGKRYSGRAIMSLEKLMAKKDIYMVWSNHITPDVGKEMLSFTETRLRETDVDSGIKKRVFSILVEILENVAKYSPGKEPELKYGMPMAMIKMEGDAFFLTTGNLIRNDNIPNLKAKLKLVNSYNREELKELYRNILSTQTSSTDSTGTMGLIDIARKSGNKLRYSFDKVNDEYSYYYLKVFVNDHEC